MKRILFVFVTLFALSVSVSAETYVLLTGVSNYPGEELDLKFSTNAVKQLKKIFDHQNANVTILTSKYATIGNITEKLNAINLLAGPDDIIIFYFSGHGGDGFFLPYSEKNEVWYYKDFVKVLLKAKTKKIFCFFDACHSGSVKDAAGKDFSWGEDANDKLTFLMGSRAEEVAYESSDIANGHLSNAMVKGLRGKADANNDRKVTLIELFKYVYDDVSKRNANKPKERQSHPQLIGPQSNYHTVLTSW